MTRLQLILGSLSLLSSCAGAQYPESVFPVRGAPPWVPTVAWQEVGSDSARDGRRPDGADGKSLAWAMDPTGDTLWFRLAVHGSLDTLAAAVSVSFDLDADQTTGMPWYGSNRAFRFDKMISVGLLRREGTRWIGYNGFSDAARVMRNEYLTEKLGRIAFATDPANAAYFVGVALSDLNASTSRIHVLASVGANARWNDDLIDAGFATIDLSAARPVR